jgi:hypothetical protein
VVISTPVCPFPYVSRVLYLIFILRQDAIDRGRILGGGKGFLVFDELVGCDIGVLLHDAFMEEVGEMLCLLSLRSANY